MADAESPAGDTGYESAVANDDDGGKHLALTLDLENDWYFEEPGYDHLTFEYIEEFVDLLGRLSVPLSVFVVGRTLERFPDAIDRLDAALDAEFHLHSYRHEETSEPFRAELKRGKAAFKTHFGHEPLGYREPYGAIDAEQFPILVEEGFEFDSSIFPTYRPGVYSNLDAPVEPYVPKSAPELLEIPLGVVRGLRIPLSQNYLKLFGRPMVELLSVAPLPETVVYNVHLQDLYRTASHDRLPGVKRRILMRNLDESVEILEHSIKRIIERGYEPVTITDVHARHRRRTHR